MRIENLEPETTFSIDHVSSKDSVDESYFEEMFEGAHFPSMSTEYEFHYLEDFK